MWLGLSYIALFAAIALAFWAQFKVKGNFKKWSKVGASGGRTGAEVARQILNNNGLHDVTVEPVRGRLSDHYDPTKKAVRLSEDVYYGTSIASVSIAAHEVGHAIQHAEAYSMLVVRHKMFPLVNITSGIAPWLIMAGFFITGVSFFGIDLLLLGIILFSFAVLFQLVTLPVEFNASSRAKTQLISEGMIRNEEERGVSKMLGSAALTYVAATLVSVVQLAQFVLIFLGNRDE